MDRWRKISCKAEHMRKALKGFTLIEIIVCLAVFGILMGTMIPLGIQISFKRREQHSLDELAALKAAIVGDPQVIADGSRLSFGYLGDMGNLPASLEDLYKKGSQPAFSLDSTKKIGAGWNGPYIDPQIVEHLETLKTDAFGNDYDYTTTPFTDSTVGATVEGRIRSKGKDGTTGGGDDLSVELFNAEIESTVAAFIEDAGGNRIGGTSVTINYPSNGSLTSSSTLADSNGFFTFNNIPYGIRSITVEPDLVLVPDTAQVVGTNDIEFSVQNFSSTDVTITSITPVYTSIPQGFYEKMLVGGVTVRDSASPRAASGEEVTFTGQTVSGTGASSDAVVMTVQSPVTEVGAVSVLTIAGGATKLIKLQVFKDDQTGSGSAVDMSGVSFTVTFSDGSVVRFTTE